MTEADFELDVRSNPVNAELLKRLAPLEIAQCHLAAGCLFQAVWNRVSGHAADWGIRDYDVFYFDEQDTSWEAEDRVIALVAGKTSDLGVRIEVRNQARVHLWYRDHFGRDYPQLTSARDGIDRYLVSCTCIGIEVRTGRIYAPNGLDDVESGILRMNPRNSQPDLFRKKAATYVDRWPWLTIVQPSR